MVLSNFTTETLSDFFERMKELHRVRANILKSITSGESIKIKNLIKLERIRSQLENIAIEDEKYTLKNNDGKNVFIELDYELGELKKDNIFLKHGEKELVNYLSNIYNSFSQQVESGVTFIKKYRFDHFVTDRDGTVSNYCGRYKSSIQSIYNAISLSEFSKSIDGQSIILTSAPLFNEGLLSVSLQNDNEYVLSGSKGREILFKGKEYKYEISELEESKMAQLENAIFKLLKKDEFSTFKNIGSGFQRKFGQITIARQDKNGSIDETKSKDFRNEILSIISKVDNDNEFFSIEDTGLDLEIMLNIKSEDQNIEEFDKGHGLKFIFEQLNENIKGKTVLICGDTHSDVPMLEMAQKMGAKVVSIFVTEEDELKEKVKEVCKHYYFVSSPDVLIYILYKYSKINNSNTMTNYFL